MTRFESRPARTGRWDYYFYVDIDGHASDAKVAQALTELQAQAAEFGRRPVDHHRVARRAVRGGRPTRGGERLPRRLRVPDAGHADMQRRRVDQAGAAGVPADGDGAVGGRWTSSNGARVFTIDLAQAGAGEQAVEQGGISSLRLLLPMR